MIERRRRRRIVTLKNFGKLLAVLAVVFVGLSFEYSRKSASDGYGRLMKSEIAPNDDLKAKPMVISEGQPIDDQSAADPLLLAPAAREQEFLSTAPQRPAPMASASVTPIATPVERRGSGNGVTIVGDGGGITIVRGDAAKRPVLAGGIFKQP